MNHCRKVVIHQPVFFSGHETREHQDRLSNTVLANRDALVRARNAEPVRASLLQCLCYFRAAMAVAIAFYDGENLDRKSTRLNSSHVAISYAVFCLKKKNNTSNI